MFTTLTGLAALSFSIGGYFMKLSAGLTHLRPTVLMFAFFSLGAVFQTVAMRGEEMAITYIVVLGFEAITALLLSMVLLNESGSVSKFAGVALVVAGIVLLRTGKVQPAQTKFVTARSKVMKRFFKTIGEDPEHGANLHSQAVARRRLLQEKENCSPRASVAFGALSAFTWLTNKLGGLVARIATSRKKGELRGNEQPQLYVVKSTIQFCAALLLLSLFCIVLHAQQAASVATVATVPRLVSFTGNLTDAEGKPILSIAGVTFAIYKDQESGSPLWLETQNVQPDSTGRYSVQLGATKTEGLPQDLFSSGEARWLGTQISGQAEQPRVLLLSVPYALKAADAETVGGFPPSAFVLAAPIVAPSASAPTTDSTSASASQPTIPAVTGTGTTNFIPLWLNSTGSLGNSSLFQTGTGTSAKIGINTTTPATPLDVKGATTVRGVLTLAPFSTATASQGTNSQPLSLIASSFNSSTSTATNEYFNWQSEASGNNTVSPSATMNLLFGSGGSKPAETGLKIASNGQITFASDQTFPGGSGTVTSVGLSAPTSDFTVTGSPITSSGTLGLNWNVAPTSANTANAIVKRDSSGSFSGTSIMGQTTVSYGASGVSGTATSTGPGGSYGVSGSAQSDSGVGVFGFAGGVTGMGLFGWGNGTTGYGVYGYGPGSSGIALYGMGGAYGVYALGETGVYGQGSQYGVYGEGTQWGLFGTSNNWGVSGFGDAAGMFAESYSGYGIWATTVDATNGAIAMYGTNTSNQFPTEELINFVDASKGGAVLETLGGYGGCTIDTSGNLYCSGSKSAVVPVESNSRKVALYAVESPENWFEDFGSARLTQGAVNVSLDSIYGQTINGEMEYHVFLTPEGDCKGLYVTNKTAQGFAVRELGGGRSSVAFDYRIVARRKGYEQIRLGDMTERFNQMDARLAKAKIEAKTPHAHPVPKGNRGPSTQ